MHKLYIGFFIAINFLLVNKLYPQSNDCSQSLTKAQDAYKEGRISEVADLLQTCLESGFSKTEKIEAFRLLTLTYLYFNEKEKAQESMTNLLKVDPEYKLRQSDPMEYVNLYNSFRTTPVVLVGGKFGVSFLDVDVKRNFSLDNSAISRGKYKSKSGIQGGLFAQFPVSKRMSILTELMYSVKKYTYSDRLFEYSSIEFPETQTYLELPVLVTYNFSLSKVVPYINLGASAALLLKAKASPVRTDETEGENQREIEAGDINVSSLRKKWNYNLLVGAGIKVKDILGRGYLFLDFRYSRGLNIISNSEKRYTSNELLYEFLYVDNDFKINSFNYTIGYSYPLYKPKVKKVKKEKN